MDFSETTVACDLKVGRCRQLIEFISIKGQGHFLSLAQGHLHMKIKSCISQITLGHFNQILCVSLYLHVNESLLK